MSEPQNSVPPPRSPLAYLGGGIAVIGAIMFISTFYSAINNFGNFANFEENTRSMGFRAVTGMVLIVVGSCIGATGGARRFGSGITQNFLDSSTTRQTARDITAGMVEGVKDATKVHRVHCPYCNSDNDSSLAKCQNCGAALAQDKTCPGCGKVNECAAHFCSQCGKALI